MAHAPDLSHSLERRILIRASRETVFRFFTDNDRWAKWWGPGSTIEPRAGGRVYIRYPNAVEASGEVVSVEPPKRLVFTFGYNNGQPIPPGSSRVTIELAEERRGTQLTLTHALGDAAVRDQHVQGWRYQLSLFSNVVTDDLHHGAATAIDDWYGAWADPDDESRAATFARIAVPEVEFHDRYSALSGLDDLTAHIGAAQKFMPGARLERQGAPRHCQGSVLSDWVMTMNGQQAGRGTNLFVFGPSGKIEWVTGFASA